MPRYEIHCAVLFFDIVGYSARTTNNEMSKTVQAIISSMWQVLDNDYYWAEKDTYASENDLLLIPTGDGYGICLNPNNKDEEILEIAKKLYKQLKSEHLRFRMGIAKAKSIITTDLNETLSITGYGVVLAVRVCAAAEEGQILIHNTLAESFKHSTQAQRKEFQEISTPYKAKHDLTFSCHNYYKQHDFGIDFLQKKKHPTKRKNTNHKRIVRSKKSTK